MPINVLPLRLKQTFPPIIWIITEGGEIESRLPFKIFFTLNQNHSFIYEFWSLLCRAAAEDILDELLKSGNMSLDDFDLSSEDPLKEEQVEATTIETLKEDPNDSGFIDITNAQHITIDGQDIFIVVAPPSPQPQQELVTSVTAPESLATLSPAHSLAQSDSDWTPDSPKASKGRPPVKRTSLKAKSSRKNQVGTPFIKDKKERKKHQNVEAARRYRDKKKSEQENVESEEQALADKNKGLKSEVSDLEIKVRTMKQLMVELGILKQA